MYVNCVFLAGGVVFDRGLWGWTPLEFPTLAKSEVLLDDDRKISVCVRVCVLAALCGGVCFDSISLIGLVRGHRVACVRAHACVFVCILNQANLFYVGKTLC